MYTDVPVGEIILRRRCQAILDFAVRIEPVTRAGALEARRLRAEARRRLYEPDLDAGPFGALFTLLAPPPSSLLEPEPMPSPELIEAERLLQIGILADDRTCDRWMRSEILSHLEQAGLEDESYFEAYIDEAILDPVLQRLRPRERAWLRPTEEEGFCDRAFEFERSFRPVGAGVRLRHVGGRGHYQLVVDLGIEVEEPTDDVVRRRLEWHEERTARARGSGGLGPEARARVAERMPWPESLAAQRRLLHGVLANDEVMAAWMARVAVAELTFGPSIPGLSYDHEIGNELDVLAPVLDRLPPRSAALLRRAFRDEGGGPVDFYDGIRITLLDVRVTSSIGR